ncbi:hypothetical protein FOXG_19818 [Fusarium oxysporum f. sp. lycopersici 4287]|uniref:Uncharacterized protein n=1 Tax=Fusarium oxysporum f. sp. lycopersici (strain 4287 / CBS 123668 / FGSC 9935 / NRRL 34936) TaxID=426428 RepID=A0A0J9WNH1_FUSO4|nr:hypothetical protein FOXG_19818 [Fusarium oxysporum f. sp. lycopersici 4287]KAJ9423966.1 hypothetical protein QL093DRAFT_2097920 [Fusarium oxysporum]KNB07272.1 hypothetical protein FOXG_19818 [Fusarium oxysporum f. sp. lycopersici 4287]
MSFQTILPSIEVDDSHVAGHQVELVTMHQMLLMDDEETEFNHVAGSSRKRSRSQSSTSSPSLEEHDDVVSPESVMDEFTNVEFIPETPIRQRQTSQPLFYSPTSDVESRFSQLQLLPLRTCRPTKRRRMESIHSNGDAEYTPNRRLSEIQARRDNQQRHDTPSPTTTHTSELPVVTKLRPVPQGASRLIEKKGQYTIRKGVRIRDYKLPGPSPWPCALPSNSLEYQCRDGFDVKEVSLGYPQPMVIRLRENGHEPITGNHKDLKPRSPSLGTTEIAQDTYTWVVSSKRTKNKQCNHSRRYFGAAP